VSLINGQGRPDDLYSQCVAYLCKSICRRGISALSVTIPQKDLLAPLGFQCACSHTEESVYRRWVHYTAVRSSLQMEDIYPDRIGACEGVRTVNGLENVQMANNKWPPHSRAIHHPSFVWQLLHFLTSTSRGIVTVSLASSRCAGHIMCLLDINDKQTKGALLFHPFPAQCPSPSEMIQKPFMRIQAKLRPSCRPSPCCCTSAPQRSEAARKPWPARPRARTTPRPPPEVAPPEGWTRRGRALIWAGGRAGPLERAKRPHRQTSEITDDWTHWC